MNFLHAISSALSSAESLSIITAAERKLLYVDLQVYRKCKNRNYNKFLPYALFVNMKNFFKNKPCKDFDNSHLSIVFASRKIAHGFLLSQKKASHPTI